MTTEARRTLGVSPHVQFRQAFWPRDPSSAAGWRATLDEAMANLRPVNRLLTDQARRDA